MFAKGPMPGYMSAKEEVLSIAPSAVCRSKTAMCAIKGFVIYIDDEAYASARSSREAWNKALSKLKRKLGEKLL